jgi:hypothetical protein
VNETIDASYAGIFTDWIKPSNRHLRNRSQLRRAIGAAKTPLGEVEQSLRRIAREAPDMNFRICVAAGAALLTPLPAVGAGALNSNRLADARGWRTPLQDIATVQAVQRALRAEGYDPGPADGTLNAKTVQALKQAQRERDLEPTGQVDRRTATALGVNPGSPHLAPDTGFVMRPRRG